MGTSRTHLNKHHVAKADAALAIAILEANQRVIDKVNSAVSTGMGTWLEKEHWLWQHAVNDTRSALFLASSLYDEVMAAQVKPSVFEAVFQTLLVGLTLINPELGMLANILQLGSDGERENREKRAKRIMGGVELLKGAFEKGMEAHEAGEKIERHETTLRAKSKIIQEKIEECSDTADFLTTVYIACKERIAELSSGPISGTELANLQQTWYTLVGGPAKHYRQGRDSELAYIMLYDMMREYCKSVKLVLKGPVEIPMPIAKARHELVGANKPSDVHGYISSIEFVSLDRAKREKMYGFFDELNELDNRVWGKSRPRIGHWVDLIKNWDFAN
jgi:hypothetical protein